MKRYIAAFLCACSLFALSSDVFAADVFDYTIDDWKALYGVPEPRCEDFSSNEEFSVFWNDWYAGLSNFIIQETQAEYARQAEAASRQTAEGQAAPASAETAPAKPIESEGASNGGRDPVMADDDNDKYPLGSYVDPDGVVWSPDGMRLSPLPSPDTVPASDPDQISVFPLEAPVVPLYLSAAEDPAPVTDQPVWYVEDLRPADHSIEILDGLKSMVASIFGEYTPVTTTTVITETVGNETRQYLVETVASGAAGVDYEWLSGVFLFGIMLFCLMKLLGGILK